MAPEPRQGCCFYPSRPYSDSNRLPGLAHSVQCQVSVKSTKTSTTQEKIGTAQRMRRYLRQPPCPSPMAGRAPLFFFKLSPTLPAVSWAPPEHQHPARPALVVDRHSLLQSPDVLILRQQEPKPNKPNSTQTEFKLWNRPSKAILPIAQELSSSLLLTEVGSAHGLYPSGSSWG